MLFPEEQGHMVLFSIEAIASFGRAMGRETQRIAHCGYCF